MTDDTRDTGIPTRAIHESYLNLQQAHRQYRNARSSPTTPERPAHGDFQDAVLTFYELLRPHLKRKSALQSYWVGEIPDYPGQAFENYAQARRYYTQRGTAVWAVQRHPQVTPLTGDAATATVTDGGPPAPGEWHERLDRGDRTRIVAAEPDREQNVLNWVEFRFEAGLRQLDGWDTRRVEHEDRREDGFLVGESQTRTELRHVDIGKLQRAKRLLAEAADKMSLLAHVDIDHEDGVITNFDQSGDEPQAGYTTGEYDSSPDI